MSSHNPNRVGGGVRQGGQFTTGAKNETTVALAERDLPIELAVGEEHSLDGDGLLITVRQPGNAQAGGRHLTRGDI